MVDLSTKYMGFDLKNPTIAASSGLTDSVEKIKKLYESGVGAIVLKSIFEEQIMREIDSLRVNNMYGTFQDAENYVSFYTKEHNLNNYFKLIEESKKIVDIPIIASISCISSAEWIDYAKKIELAGADAIELNMFILPSDINFTGKQIEKEYFEIIENIKKHVNIPIALKVSSYFSGMANIMKQLSNTGISSLVLFNRFFTPDIDLDTEKVVSSKIFSSAEDNGNTLRWVSLLAGKVNCDIAASTGIHDGNTAIKNLLAGANAVQIASTLYNNSTDYVKVMLKEIEDWMISKNYNKLSDIIGKLSSKNVKMPMMYERAQFMKYYSNHY